MTTDKITRRTILRATVATAALAAPATLAASVAGPQTPDPLIALGEQWADAVQRYEAERDAGHAIFWSMSEDARGGWPIVDQTNPLWRDLTRLECVIPSRPSLREIKAFNIERNEAVVADPVALAKSRTEGRLRLREQTNRIKAAKRECEASGYNAHVTRSDALLDEKDAIENAIEAARSTSIAGAIVKLRGAARWVRLEHSDEKGNPDQDRKMSIEERLTLAALADLDRLGGVS